VGQQACTCTSRDGNAAVVKSRVVRFIGVQRKGKPQVVYVKTNSSGTTGHEASGRVHHAETAQSHVPAAFPRFENLRWWVKGTRLAVFPRVAVHFPELMRKYSLRPRRRNAVQNAGTEIASRSCLLYIAGADFHAGLAHSGSLWRMRATGRVVFILISDIG
jgi:hypothetical protein